MQFSLVDVFAGAPFKGNPVAVVTGGNDLSTQQMLDMTRWFNLSETTFLLPPTDADADYRVRIFCPDRELPFAGHPTLGTCHAWLEGGGNPKGRAIVQECRVGLVEIRRDGAALAFAAPPLVRSGPVDEADLAKALDVLQLERSAVVEARWVDNGPGWLGIRLGSAEEVLALNPLGAYPERVDIGVLGPYPSGSEVGWELRALFTDHNGKLVEDPITGSFNASVAQWLIGEGLAPKRYKASQGSVIDRIGRIEVEQDEEGIIWIGGHTATMFSGGANI